jgi:hypothetical protein
MNDIEILPIDDMNLYVFGSSVYSENPNDLDLALIYKKESVSIEKAVEARKALIEEIRAKLDVQIEMLLLSDIEESEADFLKNAKHQKIF